MVVEDGRVEIGERRDDAGVPAGGVVYEAIQAAETPDPLGYGVLHVLERADVGSYVVRAAAGRRDLRGCLLPVVPTGPSR